MIPVSLNILAVSLAVLLFIVVALLVYAVALRINYNQRRARKRALEQQWERLLLPYLYWGGGQLTRENLRLRGRDWVLFGQFIEQYLLDLSGEDYERLVGLLQSLQFAEFLIGGLDDDNIWVRSYAVHYLGIIGYRRAIPRIREMLSDESPIVSYSAFATLHRMNVTSNLSLMVGNVLRNLDSYYTRVSDILTSYDRAIDPVLVDFINDQHIGDRARRLVIDVAAARNIQSAVPAILSLVKKTSNDEIRIGAVKALAVFEDPAAEPYLLSQLSSPNWVLRSQAIHALAKTGSGATTEAAEYMLLHDDHYLVRLYSARALAELGPAGKERLESLLNGRPDDETAQILRDVLTTETV